MKTFTSTTSISASPKKVWQVLSDVEAWGEWTPSITRIERLDAPPLGVGSKVKIEQPRLRPAIWTVTAWQPEQSFTWASRSPGVSIHADHVIVPGAQGCEVTLTLQFDGRFGGLAGILAGTLVNHYLAFETAGLKQRSEETP